VIIAHLKGSVTWKGLVPGINEMRRHYANYLKGLPNIREFRQQLVTVKTVEEVEGILEDLRNKYEGFMPERRLVDMEGMSCSCD
jgi:tRNA-dihydrouridine synthase